MDTAGRELFVFCILMVDGPVGIRRVVPQCPWPRRGAAITYTRTERAFVSSAPSAKDSAHVIISLRLCVASHPARLCMRPFCLRRSPSLGTPPHESTSTPRWAGLVSEGLSSAVDQGHEQCASPETDHNRALLARRAIIPAGMSQPPPSRQQRYRSKSAHIVPLRRAASRFASRLVSSVSIAMQSSIA